MLFNYRYVTHGIEAFQVWLEHLVKEVWGKATGDFHVDLLHPVLKAVVIEIYNTEESKTIGKTGDWLHGPIRDIFNQFKMLTDVERQQIIEWYDSNNDIEALCAGDPAMQPGTYAEIEAINEDLSALLKTFCQSLFSDVIHLKPVASRIGSIEEHYEAFVTENRQGKCPYCGYNGLKGQHHSRREAYDHYLPKGTYPFNTVNFRNLAPMCHECNSSYKTAKDPTRHLDPLLKRRTYTRRKAFYTYGLKSPQIGISMSLHTQEIAKLQPEEITLDITAPGQEEELEAWKDVFDIEERYKALCCGENDGKYWMIQIVEECQNDGKSPGEILAKVNRQAKSHPWAEVNFLKKPFLDACQAAKLIRV